MLNYWCKHCSKIIKGALLINSGEEIIVDKNKYILSSKACPYCRQLTKYEGYKAFLDDYTQERK